MTSGQHDDAVSASYFAVADINVSSVDDLANYYDDNNLLILKNKNINDKPLNGAFYE